jgi:predicted lipid-binding transport protein (Tim44 family)
MAPLPDVSSPTDDTLLTAAQQRILAALDSSKVLAHGRPEPDNNTFWQVFLGVLGISLLLMGTVLVFFFAALGAVVLATGGLTLVGALRGAAFSAQPQETLRAGDDGGDAPPPALH